MNKGTLHDRLLDGVCWYLTCLMVIKATIAEMITTQAIAPSTIAAKIPLLMPALCALITTAAKREITR